MLRVDTEFHYQIVPGVYRRNVGIVLRNWDGRVLWARRIRNDGWQFPQGGVDENESTDEAAYRELYEELGLDQSHVRLIGKTKNWLKYDIPKQYHSTRYRNKIRGQIQKWYLFQFVGDEMDVCLDRGSEPEFNDWTWVDYWVPVERVVSFKRNVYQQALTDLERFIL